MTDEFAPLMHCGRCGGVTRVALRKNILANGSVAVFIACLETRQSGIFESEEPLHRVKTNGENVSHQQAIKWGFKIDEIPILHDYSVKACAVYGCTENGVESHHWAPKEIFGHEAELWPQAQLCLKHHTEWHRRMRDYGWKPTSKAADMAAMVRDLAEARKL